MRPAAGLRKHARQEGSCSRAGAEAEAGADGDTKAPESEDKDKDTGDKKEDKKTPAEKKN